VIVLRGLMDVGAAGGGTSLIERSGMVCVFWNSTYSYAKIGNFI
jgi:hypothetical protein